MKRTLLTELEPVWHGAIPRVMFVVLDGFPKIPAAKIVDNVALGILDLVPFDYWDARLLDETRDVEDFAKSDRCSISADVRWGKHSNNWHPLGEGAEVDEVSVSHDIVR